MNLMKIIAGSLLMLVGVGLIALGVYIVLSIFSFGSLGGFVVLFGFGTAIFYIGFLLARGEDVKDALYFLSFFH